MTSERRATRDDVARAAGTSTAVVSYVLNNGPRPVAPATRERVLRAVRELGYRPNALAAGLRSHRSNLLGLVVPDVARPFFAEISTRLGAQAFEQGLTLLSLSNGWNVDHERRQIEELLALRVRGIAMAPISDDPEPPLLVHSADTRLALVSRPVPDVPAPVVMSDALRAGRIATEHLLEHGHATVVCVTGPDDAPPVGLRVAGWRHALEDAERDPDPLLLRTGFDRYAAERAAADFLVSRPAPVALMAATDEIALGCLAAAARLGRAVPHDVALVGCDGIPEGHLTTPALTSVDQDFDGLAASVLAILIDEGTTDSPPPGPVRLRVGGTCGCVVP